MEEKAFCTKLKRYSKGSEFMLRWDRKNGALERVVIFEGFKKNNPQLYFKEGRNQLDICKIGGYSSIISIEKMD